MLFDLSYSGLFFKKYWVTMFGIEALNIVIGLIFIYLLFSLFVSIINEIIGNLFNSRGSKLFDSIHALIGEDGIKEMMNDHRIKALADTGSDVIDAASKLSDIKKAWPDYIPESVFADVIADLDNSKLKGSIENLDTEIKNSALKIKEIYETALVKTRKTYINYARKLTIVVSAMVVLAFNVDSISIFKDLANNPEHAAIVANMAERYITENDSSSSAEIQQSIADLKIELADLHKTQLQDLDSTLGLGWQKTRFWTDLKWHSIPGWIITILALSLGAPFWFDLLKKVVNIKQELKNAKS